PADPGPDAGPRATRYRPPPPTPSPPPRAPEAPMPDPRRSLPAVDALLAAPDVTALARAHPRSLVVRAVRETLESARANGGAAPPEGWGAAVRACLQRLAAPSFVPVLNATGVVLHTHSGRAPPAAAWLPPL